MEIVGRRFEFGWGKTDMVTTSGNSDNVVVDLGPNEKMIVGSTIGSGTYAETKMGYSNLGAKMAHYHQFWK